MRSGSESREFLQDTKTKTDLAVPSTESTMQWVTWLLGEIARTGQMTLIVQWSSLRFRHEIQSFIGEYFTDFRHYICKSGFQYLDTPEQKLRWHGHMENLMQKFRDERLPSYENTFYLVQILL